MLFSNIQLSQGSIVAAAGGTIQVSAEVSRAALARAGRETSELSIKARLLDVSGGYVEIGSPVSMSSLGAKTKGRYIEGALVIAAAELTATQGYVVEVYLSDDITPTTSAQAEGAPAVIAKEDVASAVSDFIGAT